MTKKNKTIFIVIVVIVLVGVGLRWGFYQLPDCSLFGGFQMFNPDAPVKSCDCAGLEIYYIKEAMVDGISASKCIGIMTNIK